MRFGDFQRGNVKFESLINFDAKGGRCDVTPVFRSPEAFLDLLERFQVGLRGQDIEIVAGIDALGFVVGTALALRLNRGLLVIRKGGKLPVESDRTDFTDYSGGMKSLELAKGAVPMGAKILLVDEWIETGAQARAAIGLIEGQGGKVVAIAAMKIDKPGLALGFGQRFCLSLL
jgi:adenine phosphoribosyltransferase